MNITPQELFALLTFAVAQNQEEEIPQRSPFRETYERTLGVITAVVGIALPIWLFASWMIGGWWGFESANERALESRGFDHVTQQKETSTKEVWSVTVRHCAFRVVYDKGDAQFMAHEPFTGKITTTVTAENLRRSFPGETYQQRCVRGR